MLHITARDDVTGNTILDDDVSFGVTRDKRELVKLAKSVENAVDTGRIDPSRTQSAEDPEAVELLQRARSKVIPFLEDDEAVLIRTIVTRLESSVDDGSRSVAKDDLRKALARYSYLF